MEIEFNPSNLEAMFVNRLPPSETFNLLHFVPCTKNWVENPFKDEHGNFFYLDFANNYINKPHYGSKQDWILSTINYPIFNRKGLFLYKHNGEYGYYDFNNKTFNKFQEDISPRIYKFFYDNMSLN
jgi:hypothetical protein